MRGLHLLTFIALSAISNKTQFQLYTSSQIFGRFFQDKSHLAGVDTNMDCGSIGLLSLHTLNVDDVLLPVDLHNLADLLAFVVSTNHLFVNTTTKCQANAPYISDTTHDYFSTIQTTIPGLRRLCGWAWTSHCTSGGAPWTEGKT